MKLYGVEHGGDFLFGGFSVAKMDVQPASELVSAIQELPLSSTVGLETIPEAVEIQDPQLRYWQALIEICQDAGHNIAYLDNSELVKYLSRQRWEIEQLESGLANSKYQVNPGKERDIAEFQFGLEADFNYVLAVAREDAIFTKLLQMRPDLVIVGLAHADYYMLNPDLRPQLGVEDYWRSRLDTGIMPEFLPLISDNIPVLQELELSEPKVSVLTEREFNIRTYRAASLGRIAVDCEPAWIGSWQPDCRSYGLFEVYPDGADPSEGSIEDRLGTARYEGEFGNEGIIFTKEYIASKVLTPDAYMGQLTYEAEPGKDGEFVGKWHARGVKADGDFVIKRGNKLFDPEPFLFGQQKLF